MLLVHINADYPFIIRKVVRPSIPGNNCSATYQSAAGTFQPTDPFRSYSGWAIDKVLNCACPVIGISVSAIAKGGN